MVHGGVIDTMAEAAISYAAYYTQEGTWVGVNNNTDFIKAVTEGMIICEATPIKLGKDHRFGKQNFTITTKNVHALQSD